MIITCNSGRLVKFKNLESGTPNLVRRKLYDLEIHNLILKSVVPIYTVYYRRWVYPDTSPSFSVPIWSESYYQLLIFLELKKSADIGIPYERRHPNYKAMVLRDWLNQRFDFTNCPCMRSILRIANQSFGALSILLEIASSEDTEATTRKPL